MINKKSLFAAAVVGCIAGSTSASAINLEEAIQCAIMETINCGPGIGCETGRAAKVNLPDFILIDLPGGQVTGNRPDGTDLATQIERVEKTNGATVIQGGEEGLGWTILLNAESGHMTFSGSKDDVGFILFGACIQD